MIFPKAHEQVGVGSDLSGYPALMALSSNKNLARKASEESPIGWGAHQLEVESILVGVEVSMSSVRNHPSSLYPSRWRAGSKR